MTWLAFASLPARPWLKALLPAVAVKLRPAVSCVSGAGSSLAAVMAACVK